MGEKLPPIDWTKASKAEWDRVANQTCREAQAKFDQMSDEDWVKEFEDAWDGPISVSAAHFMSISKDSSASHLPTERAAHRAGALSKLGRWIANRLALSRRSGISPP